MRKRAWQWVRILALLAAFAVLIYIFRDTDPEAIWLSLIQVDPLYLIPVLIGVLGMPLSRAVRLKYIMEPKRNLSVRRVFAVYNVGQLLNITLPALSGQVGRVLLFSRTWGVTKTFAFTAVILEVLFDGLVLVMMVSAASVLEVMPEEMVRGEVVVLLACLFLLGFFYLVLHRQRHQHRPRRKGALHKWLPQRLVREWDNVRSSFLAGLEMLTSRKHLFLSVLLSVFSWLAHALIILYLLRAFNIDVPFWGAIVILIVNTAGIMVPMSPGNIGIFQLACVTGMGMIGVPKEQALAFSIPLHIVEILPVYVLGAISSFSAHVRIREFMGDEVLAEQERLAAGESVDPEPSDDPADAEEPPGPLETITPPVSTGSQGRDL